MTRDYREHRASLGDLAFRALDTSGLALSNLPKTLTVEWTFIVDPACHQAAAQLLLKHVTSSVYGC